MATLDLNDDSVVCIVGSDGQWETDPVRQYRHQPHEMTGSTAIFVPCFHPSAAEPTATISPPSKCPMTMPAGAKGCALRSDPHTPQAATRMTTWSAAGAGSGSSTTSKP